MISGRHTGVDERSAAAATLSAAVQRHPVAVGGRRAVERAAAAEALERVLPFLARHVPAAHLARWAGVVLCVIQTIVVETRAFEQEVIARALVQAFVARAAAAARQVVRLALVTVLVLVVVFARVRRFLARAIDLNVELARDLVRRNWCAGRRVLRAREESDGRSELRRRARRTDDLLVSKRQRVELQRVAKRPLVETARAAQRALGVVHWHKPLFSSKRSLFLLSSVSQFAYR